MAAARDELVGRLVATGLGALGALAPGGGRMTAARGAAVAAGMGLVDRVHRDAADMRFAAEPARPAGLADVDVAVVRVRHRADRREAALVDQALFARVQPQDGVALVAAD